MPSVLAFADDLTGALEAGAKFAARGVSASVTVEPGATGAYDAVVIDTESRHLPGEDAAARVSAVAGAGARIIYKKTDSTLRGNIAAELRALVRAYPGSRIAYVPAYPALGRTVKQGELRVDGVPVDRTSFADDLLNPIAHSSIARLLGDDLPCTVYDGETDSEVAQAVSAALAGGCRIVAGPASVAEAIAAQLDVPRRPARPWPRIDTCLIVNGSLHDASASQIAFAEATGAASTAPGAPWRILRRPIGAGLLPLEIAAETGRAVQQCLAASKVDALMVFGGDTAFGILSALGCPPLEPLGEVVTGVPVARVVGRDLWLITKAGGFGDEQLVRRVKDILYGTGKH